MIYVVTPYLFDFKQVLANHNLECPIVNGVPKSLRIKWVYDAMQLVGVKRIKSTDEILYGYQSHRFEEKDLNKIKSEIQIRSY